MASIDDDGGREETVRSPSGTVGELTNRELLSRIVAEGTSLVKKEIELARTELTADLRAEVKTAKALGIGAVLSLSGLTLVFVTIALGLSVVMPAWLAALIVTVLVLAIAGVIALVGWKRRVRNPLARTRKHLREDAHYVKQRLS